LLRKLRKIESAIPIRVNGPTPIAAGKGSGQRPFHRHHPEGHRGDAQHLRGHLRQDRALQGEQDGEQVRAGADDHEDSEAGRG
jgi:hypothetical protein